MISRLFLLGAPVLAAMLLLLTLGKAGAQNASFNYSGTVVTYTIPVDGMYQITLAGANGGSGGSGLHNGGVGALVTGHIYFTSGTVLDIIVGGGGTNSSYGGGGGGGTAVISSNGFMVVAGGGGGAGTGGNGMTGGSSTGGTGLGGAGYGISSGSGGGGGANGAGGNGTGGATGGGSGISGGTNTGGSGGVANGGGGGMGGYGFGGGGGGSIGPGGGGGGYTGGSGDLGASGANQGLGGKSLITNGFLNTVGGSTNTNSAGNGYVFIVVPVDLYVGSNSTVPSTNFTSGTNWFVNTYVGYGADATNNLLTVSNGGTVLSNSANLHVGYYGASNSMRIATGGTVFASNGYVGFGSDSSNNSVLVTGTGSRLSNSGNLYVGYNGSSNSLTISGGASVLNSNMWIGYAVASTNNSVLITGAGSMLSNSGSSNNNHSLEVGGSGNTLTVSAGGHLYGSQNDYFGGNSNRFLVTGSNSLYSNGGNEFYLGYYSTGNTMVVSSNAHVIAAGNAQIGVFAGGSNSIQVTSDATFSATGAMIVGAGTAFNTMTVSGGGTLTGGQDVVGTYTSGSNTLTITGAGSYYSNSSSLTIGQGALAFGNTFIVSSNAVAVSQITYMGWESSLLVTGGATMGNLGGLSMYGDSNTVVVSGSGTLTGNNDFIGYTGGANTLTITDTNTLYSNAGNLYVGYGGGDNGLIVSNGGRVTVASNSYIGQNPYSSNNSVLVTGNNSLWSNAGDLYVGNFGSSNGLVISNGGTVIDANGFIDPPIAHGSNNSVLVTGSNSLWSNSMPIYIGYNGSGNSLVISNGGKVSADYTTASAVGYGANSSNNSVLVTGGNSQFSVLSDNLLIGLDGSSNSLVISDGGTVSVSGEGTIGKNAGSSNNSVLVTGSNSLWSNGAVYVGGDGSSNTLVVSNGGTVTDFAGNMGFGATSFGNLAVVTGSNSLWTNSGDLLVGNDGTSNNLVISNGGKVFSLAGYIGYGSNATGNLATVTASNSSWKMSGDLYVGYAGQSNRLVIANGGFVSNVNGFDDGANPSDGYNSVLVTGEGSRWSNSGNLTFGLAGHDNALVVSNGGTVSVGEDAALGQNVLASNNSAVVTGSNSLWLIGGDLNVGEQGSGNSLVISNGGHVLVGISSAIGDSSGSNNSVLVTGAGSLWSNWGQLHVGNYGSGSLTVSASGSVIAGSGMYIASTSNSLGTLNIGSYGGSDTSGTISTPSITFGSGSATINFNQTDSFRLTSSITGTGSLNQFGTGTTILSGNTAAFAGTATVSSGTLSLPVGLTVSSLIWDSSATIALPGAGSARYLTSTGAVTLTGSGTNTFDLTGVTLGGGQIELFAFGSNPFTTNQFSVTGLSDYVLSVSNNALWIAANGLVARTNDTIISNTATYPTVTFQTNGILTVTPSADLTITAPVDVTNNGTVVLNGVLNSPGLTVSPGGTLAGTGMLNGNLTNGGMVAPGNSPGTLTVNGNFTQTPGGTLLIRVGNGLNSLLSVNGTATLGGALVVSSYDGHRFQYGDQIIFLSATSITGDFSSVVVPEGFRGRVKVFGDPQLELIMAPVSYTQMARNRNQSNVARALDSFTTALSGDRLVVSTTLDSLTAAQYNQAFNAIMPSFYQQMATIAFNSANAQNMELSQRLWGLRVAEGGGFSMSGLADNYAMIQEGQGDGAGTGSGKGVLDSKKDILRPGLDNHWGMFVDGNGIFAQANSGNMLPGYTSESGGVTAGLTYKWNENVGTGIYAGYQGTYNRSGANGSGLGVGSTLVDNAVRFGVFGTYGQKDAKGAPVGFYGNALAGGGYNNYQATRIIQYPGLNRTANSSPGAGELDTMLGGGYDLQKGNLTYGPTASLQYTYLGVNGVNETGAQSLNFNSGGWNSSSMLSSLGAHAAYNWQAGRNILVVPQVSLNWQHEFMQNPYAISGNLGGTSPTFSNWSAAPIRDFLYTGVGFTVEIGKRWNTSFFYNAAAGNQNLVSQNIFWSAGLKF